MEVDPGELRTHFTDLLDARLGGRAIECSDQWFAGCENLVNPDPPVYKAVSYTHLTLPTIYSV